MTEQTEREVLEALWESIHGKAEGIAALAGGRLGNWLRFTAMLDAGAYLDAAMMLVPEGWDWAVGSAIKGDFFANLDFDKAVHASTPALALAAAIAASREAGE